MNRIQDVASVRPYMTAVGNHGKSITNQMEYLKKCIFLEIPFNFSHYRNRFTMPTTESPFWYSMNIGPIHFVR